MSRPFSLWTDRVEAASDEASLRGLLAEIAVSRARNLLDTSVQRAAAYGLAQVHRKLGNHDAARNEAEQLVNLLGAPPEANAEERKVADAFLRELSGGKARPERAERAGRGDPREPRAPRAERGEATAGRREREPRREAPPRDPFAAALDAARQGRLAEAERLVRDAAGARVSALRGYLALLAGDLDAAKAQLQEALFGRPSAASKPAVAGDDVLTALVGPLPERREARIDALEAWADAHPDQQDALAAAALRQHVADQGPRQPAPWLAGVVGRALASGEAPATRAAIAELEAAGAFAVTAYQEAPFGVLVALLRELRGRGGAIVSLRRGVLHRDEPSDRKLWTLRVTLADGGERLAVVAPPAEEPVGDAMAVRLAKRLAELSGAVVLSAPGVGNAGLRAVALVGGFSVTEDTDAASLADRVVAMAPAERPGPAPRAPRAPKTEDAAAVEPARAERKPRATDAGPSPFDRIAELFAGESVATEEAYAEPLGALRRVFRGFAPVRRAVDERPAEDVDARLAPLLRAIHGVAPAGVRLAEGITLALRVASRVPGGAVESLLAGDDPASLRYGGAGIGGALRVARAAQAAGARVDRVLTGLSRRERDGSPVLAALSGPLGGLWRLLVSEGDRRGEVWWVSDLTPEGMAAIPQLLLEERPRVLVVDPALAAWAGGLGARLLADDDGLSGALHDAIAAWPVSSAPAESDDEG